MKLPNLASIIAVALAIIPALTTALTNEFPQSEYWWSALIVTALAGLGKYLQERSDSTLESMSPHSTAYRVFLR